MEEAVSSCRNSLVAVNTSRTNHADGRLRMLHHSTLNRTRMSAQHDVRMSGQAWVVQPEPVTTSEEKSSYCQFRFGVLAAYGSHVVVPLAVG